MIISSAHIFAKQITGRVPRPTGNVYFEGGQFNEALAYPNTSFSNKRVLRDDFDKFNNGGGIYLYNLISSDIATGKIIQCLGNLASEYVLTGDNITCDNDPQPYSFNDYYGLLLLPLRLPANTYTKMCGRFLKSDINPDAGYAFHFYQSYVRPEYFTQNLELAVGAYVYDYGDTVDVAFDLPTGDGTWHDSSVFVAISTGGYKHSEIQKIWFE